MDAGEYIRASHAKKRIRIQGLFFRLPFNGTTCMWISWWVCLHSLGFALILFFFVHLSFSKWLSCQCHPKWKRSASIAGLSLWISSDFYQLIEIVQCILRRNWMHGIKSILIWQWWIGNFGSNSWFVNCAVGSCPQTGTCDEISHISDFNWTLHARTELHIFVHQFWLRHMRSSSSPLIDRHFQNRPLGFRFFFFCIFIFGLIF